MARRSAADTLPWDRITEMSGQALLRRGEWPFTRQALRKGLLVPAITLGVVVALIVVIRLILDPLATHETRKALNQLKGFQGDFERVHVTIFGPGYDITRLKLVEAPLAAARDPDPGHAGKADVLEREPLIYVERLHVGVSWRELLHLRLVANLRLEEPKITITQKATPAPKTPKTIPAPDLSAQLEKVTELKVDRIDLLEGEILFREASGPRRQELWVHHLELVAQNLATRPHLARGRAATVSAHGLVGNSGRLNLFVSADPFASPLSFAGQVSVQGLEAAELYAFIEPKLHLQAGQGTIDVFAEFVSKQGLLTGGVKPVLKNIEIRPTDDGPWNRLKAWLADKTVETASDRVEGRNAVATTIPIKGKLTDPDIQLWPTVLGVIRNAFVQGLTSGFANVPPATAEKKQGVLEQARNAFKKGEGPPKAQPATP